MIRAALLILVLGAPSPELRRGLEFGALEMAHTARLLGSDVRLAFSETEASRPDAVIVTAGPRRDVATTPAIHLVAPPATAGPCDFSIAAPAARADVVLWHQTLFRYGASELNERFSRKYGVPMSEEAWKGWVAVKAIVESALRARQDEPCAALAALRFDGHKGRPLHFDPATRTLVQPLYVIKEGRVAGEAK